VDFLEVHAGGHATHTAHTAHATRGHTAFGHRALGGRNDIVNAQDHDRCFCGRGDGLGLDTERLDNTGRLHIDCLTFEDIEAEGLLALFVCCTDLDEHIDWVKTCVLCKGAGDDFECGGKCLDGKLGTSAYGCCVLAEAQRELGLGCTATNNDLLVLYYNTNNAERPALPSSSLPSASIEETRLAPVARTSFSMSLFLTRRVAKMFALAR
jgi:hypothetical protein